MNNIDKSNRPNKELIRAIEGQEHAYADNHILGPYGLDLALVEYQRSFELVPREGAWNLSPEYPHPHPCSFRYHVQDKEQRGYSL